MKFKILITIAKVLVELSELLNKLANGFCNLAMGEKWNFDDSLYEQDLTMEEFNARVCGSKPTLEDIYEEANEIANEFFNYSRLSNGGESDEQNNI